MPINAITPPAAKILLTADFFTGDGNGEAMGFASASSSLSGVRGVWTPGVSRNGFCCNRPCITMPPVGLFGF